MWRLIVPRPRHIAALGVFLVLLTGGLYFVARSSEPYEAAERFLASDGRIASAVGVVNQVTFKFWEGFHFTGADASFTFELVGSRSTSVVALQLRRSAGTWRVVTAEVRAPDGSTSRLVG